MVPAYDLASMYRKSPTIGCVWDIIDAKTVRLFPKLDRKTGERLGFGRLKNAVRKVMVQHDSGDVITVNYTIDRGWSIQWPDKKVPPKIDTVRGRIDNYRSAKVLVKGDRQSFESLSNLERKLREMGMAPIVDEVLRLLAGGKIQV